MFQPEDIDPWGGPSELGSPPAHLLLELMRLQKMSNGMPALPINPFAKQSGSPAPEMGGQDYFRMQNIPLLGEHRTTPPEDVLHKLQPIPLWRDQLSPGPPADSRFPTMMERLRAY
jgi:hypothetical protein